MSINKFIKRLKPMTQLSPIVLTICLYVLFIMVVLSISFPLKSHNKRKFDRLESEREHKIGYMSNESDDDDGNDVGDNDVGGGEGGEDSDDDNVADGNRLGENEHRYLQRARNLPSFSNRSDILRDAFQQADLDGNALLSLQELARYINRRIRNHIEASIHSNPIQFSEIDRSPPNGLVTWDEYYAHFLRTLGFDDAFIRKIHSERDPKLDRKTKESLMREKALWNEAARTDSFSLTLDEFLAFRHPESSASNMLSLVDDLLRQFDEDGDDHLTMDEFSNVVADDLDDKWRQYMIEKNTFQRQEEFKRLIDKNHDGIADRSELLSYVSPKHPRHALQEAAALFNIADKNKDQRLSFKEFTDAGNVFMASRMIDSARTFHDDFR